MNRLHVVVLWVAAMLIPIGTVCAEGSKTKADAGLSKVWRKLQAAVKSGKMSAESDSGAVGGRAPALRR